MYIKKIRIASRKAKVTYNNEIFEITLEACHNTVKDSYEAWFYFNNDKHAKHFMFSVPANSVCPDHFLMLIENSIPIYAPLIALKLDEYIRYNALATYIYDYENLAPSKKKELLIEAGVFHDNDSYDMKSEEDRYIYAQEEFRDWKYYRNHNTERT